MKNNSYSSVNWSDYKSWSLVLPPNRPGEKLLNEIHLSLSIAKRIENICILGSTPEYRTLCGNFPCNITVIDKTKDFFDFASSLCVKSKKERFINKDWIDELTTSDSKYDFILSHLTHGNIPFSKRRHFFRAISNSLTKNGRFIDYIFQPKKPGYTIPEICHIFKNRPLNLRTINDFNSIALFQNQVIQKIQYINTTEIYRFLEEKISHANIKLIIENTKHLTPPNNCWDYSFEAPPDHFGYDEYFKPLCKIEEPPSSPFFGSAQLVISEKKNG